jgi:hypothetical protein
MSVLHAMLRPGRWRGAGEPSGATGSWGIEFPVRQGGPRGDGWLSGARNGGGQLTGRRQGGALVVAARWRAMEGKRCVFSGRDWYVSGEKSLIRRAGVIGGINGGKNVC